MIEARRRMFVRALAVLLLAGIVLTAPRAAAADDDDFDSDRPDAAVSPMSLAPGRIQLEAGWSREWLAAGPAADTYGEGVVRIGATSRSELRLLPPSRLALHGGGGPAWHGWSTAGAGFKWRFTPKEARVPLGIVLDATFPGGEGGARQRTVDATLTLASGVDVPLGSLQANVALVREGDPDARAWRFASALSWGQNWTARWSTFVEWYTQPADAGRLAELFDTGASFRVARSTALDVRGGMRLGETESDFVLGAGLTRRW